MKPSTLAHAKSMIERSWLDASKMHSEQGSFELLTGFFSLPLPNNQWPTAEEIARMPSKKLAVLARVQIHQSFPLTPMTYHERKEATALACLLYTCAGATDKEVEALVGRYNTAVNLHRKLAKCCIKSAKHWTMLSWSQIKRIRKTAKKELLVPLSSVTLVPPSLAKAGLELAKIASSPFPFTPAVDRFGLQHGLGVAFSINEKDSIPVADSPEIVDLLTAANIPAHFVCRDRRPLLAGSIPPRGLLISQPALVICGPRKVLPKYLHGRRYKKWRRRLGIFAREGLGLALYMPKKATSTSRERLEQAFPIYKLARLTSRMLEVELISDIPTTLMDTQNILISV